jgi:Domain of unknown function DUF11/SdrD B-like domain
MHYLKLIMLCMLLCFTSQLSAEAICAEVKIEIPQRLTMERQAFIARLGIENEVDLEISDLSVTLEFKDDQGNSVQASGDPNASGALFFFRTDDSNGISGGVAGSGLVAANSSAFATWLIVPAAGTGGNSPLGKNYAVGATIRYTQGGETRSVNVVPDTIIVEPQPKLKLDYFLPDDVYSDDPFTPVAEPPVPFTLGVRVKNVGGGTAKRTQIESAQPRIVANAQGLLIDFRILSGFVQNDLVQPSLLLSFGDILPLKAKVGRWQMTTTLTGRFTDFETAFTHDASVGGALTSLIETVTPHTLVKDVLVNLPGRDTVRDFLARDKDTYRSFESEGVDTEVLNRTDEAQIEAVAPGRWRITLPSSILPSYARVPDPTNGRLQIQTAARVGGANLPAENAWVSKTRLGTAISFSHFINVYDPTGSGQYLITAVQTNQAKLGGEVFRDRNSNGSRDPNENGILNATVRLAGMTDTGDTVNRTLQTNPDGGFQFTELSVGSYQLQVDAMPGLTDGVASAGNANGTANPGVISNIRITENLVASNYKFAKLSLSANPLSDASVVLESLAPSIGTNQTLDVTVRVRNLGPDDASTSTLINLQSGLSLVSAQTSNGTFDAVSRRWQSATLIAGSDATLLLTVRANYEGSRVLEAATTGSLTDPLNANNVARLTISASTLAGDLYFRDGFENIKAVDKSVLAATVEPAKPQSFHFIGAERVFDSAAESQRPNQMERPDLLLGIEPLQSGFEETSLGFEQP